MQELLAGSTPMSWEGNYDFGPVKRPNPVLPPTPVCSPMQSKQSDEEPLEGDLDAPGLKQRHDSFFPPTPALSPIDNGGKLRELSLRNSATSLVEIDADSLLDANVPSNTSQVHDREAQTENISKALHLLRNRHPWEWSERIPEVLARGELESLMDMIGLADREGFEY